MAPDGNERQRDRIIAAEDAEIARSLADDVHHLSDISGSFLYGHVVWNLGKPQRGFRFDVAAGPARNIVHNDRYVLGLGNSLEVLVVSLLSRLVVIRSNGENAIGPNFLCPFRHLDSLCRRIASGSGNYRDAAFHLLDDDLQHAIGFI